MLQDRPPRTSAYPIACDLAAIAPESRPRHRVLLRRLREAMCERGELPDGYAFRLNGALVSLVEVAEWAALERACCPFLTFEIEAPAGETDWWIRLRGAAGVKEFLECEFAS